MAKLVQGERSILIGFLSGPNFAIQTAKMDRSRTEFTEFVFLKRNSKENILMLSRNQIFSSYNSARVITDKMCCAVRKFEIEP